VLVSPVHGDLNAKNVFLWLEHPDQPFLIDFPYFQESGHAMQDFARLEVEMKFALMDRQLESPPNRDWAFDLTLTQVPGWCRLESLLHSDRWETAHLDCVAGVYPNNILLTLELVRVLRRSAREVQGRDADAQASFDNEYLPALLYHTLRAIGFESLVEFKRLVAVRSAARIIEKLSSL
jgi:hypothetical protein